jgi:hypothetical protein
MTRCALLLVLLLPACGEVRHEPGGVALGDAGFDVRTELDASGSDATPADGAPEVDATVVSRRCDNASWNAAPSGAPCDPRRITRSGSLESECFGPELGSGCDSLVISLKVGQDPPAGFVCKAVEQGVRLCAWDIGDASFFYLDSAALEAACSATQAFPSPINVHCKVHGS